MGCVSSKTTLPVITWSPLPTTSSYTLTTTLPKVIVQTSAPVRTTESTTSSSTLTDVIFQTSIPTSTTQSINEQKNEIVTIEKGTISNIFIFF